MQRSHPVPTSSKSAPSAPAQTLQMKLPYTPIQTPPVFAELEKPDQFYTRHEAELTPDRTYADFMRQQIFILNHPKFDPQKPLCQYFSERFLSAPFDFNNIDHRQFINQLLEKISTDGAILASLHRGLHQNGLLQFVVQDLREFLGNHCDCNAAFEFSHIELVCSASHQAIQVHFVFQINSYCYQNQIVPAGSESRKPYDPTDPTSQLPEPLMIGYLNYELNPSDQASFAPITNPELKLIFRDPRLAALLKGAERQPQVTLVCLFEDQTRIQARKDEVITKLLDLLKTGQEMYSSSETSTPKPKLLTQLYQNINSPKKKLATCLNAYGGQMHHSLLEAQCELQAILLQYLKQTGAAVTQGKLDKASTFEITTTDQLAVLVIATYLSLEAHFFSPHGQQASLRTGSAVGSASPVAP